MDWPVLLRAFFGGAFVTNAIPHLVCGLTGRPFQSPFAKPPGIGLSSSTVNFLWGFFNAAIAWLLPCRADRFDLHYLPHAAAFGLGVLCMGLHAARHFGRLHGSHPSGNDP